jgi:hypothetical protein
MTDDDTTVDELTDRINELEAQVEQQQATLAKMLPTRRSLLKGGATLGAGALVGSAVTGLASADPTWSNATGGWGTQSTPLDEIIVRNGVFQSLSTGERTVERLGGRGISNSLQSIPDSTVATVELDAIDQEDDATVLDVDTSNNRIRVKKAGWVSISAAAKYDDTLGDGTEYRTRISVNGSTITEDISSTGADSIGGAALTDAKDLSVDDDIELIVYQTSGSSKNLRATEDVSLVGIYEG